jgi:hypothetical protein
MQKPEKLEAKYANYFQVGQNAIEFIVEFGQLYPNDVAPLLHTRIITSPLYASHLLTVLKEALDQYKGQFGPLPEL